MKSHALFIVITLIYFISTIEGSDLPGIRLRELLQQDVCCKTIGEEQGLECGCRQACSGTPCDAAFGTAALCGGSEARCCCGNACDKDLQPALDNCPTAAPTANPSLNPSLNPSVAPTDTQCAEWIPETPPPTTNPSDIPVPGSPQLCQLGRSGEWNSLDQWYSWHCTCYDALTLFMLTQFIQAWFMQFQINFSEQTEGQFESYLNNYCTDNIFFETSIGNGPNWNNLESLTSCSPSNPGYPQFSRDVAQNMDFYIVPGGVSIRDCTDNGNVASARVIINNYRIQDVTDNQVVFGDFIVEREQNLNIWLFKEIVFTSNSVGFLSQD